MDEHKGDQSRRGGKGDERGAGRGISHGGEPTQRAGMRTFAEVYEKALKMDGESVKLSDLIGEEFVVRSFQQRPSKYSKGGASYVSVQIEMNGEPYYFNSASRPLMDQLHRTAGGLPYVARLVRKKAAESGREYLSLE